ncbi:hypothetical protein [Segniliparus rugosus]|uniref:Uncharacterized protein n=1 Tax=Segniliparus rugosus (strain ATCC BAA-974 / DSM 45345 / CCUG 50838 / CIP 108380 / JCM 13579 / CDC 945) TaxID=679197 RepID=E5XU69_SEGRC|nr:hypothetical protein [Segniliparus rugosus]EFV12132.1 hypothetical protein HMPREF9336_03041 [Segniliparus rugosus ATCC BAA-974]
MRKYRLRLLLASALVASGAAAPLVGHAHADPDELDNPLGYDHMTATSASAPTPSPTPSPSAQSGPRVVDIPRLDRPPPHADATNQNIPGPLTFDVAPNGNANIPTMADPRYPLPFGVAPNGAPYAVAPPTFGVAQPGGSHP